MRSQSYAQLVKECAPDSVLRSLLEPLEDESPTPQLFRGLISTLLRAAERTVVHRVRSALQVAAFSGKKARNFAALLGFTITTAPDTRREVLHEIISSAMAGRVLRADGPALKFYINAGHGSLDAEEYEKPEAEGLGEAVAFGSAQAAVEIVRQHALTSFISFVAEAVVAFQDTIKDERLLVGDSRVRTMLVDGVIKNRAELNNERLHALHLLFSSVGGAESPKGRSDVVTHMLGAFSGAAKSNASSLSLYLREIVSTKIVLEACVLYLKQRFEVKNIDPKKMSMKMFVTHVLDVKIQKNRPNKVLPAVCAALLECFVEAADNEDVDNNGDVFEHDDLLLATMHSKGDELLRKCAAGEEVNNWFKDKLLEAQVICSLVSQRMEKKTLTRR